MNTVALDGRNLTIETLARIARDPAVRVEVPEALRPALRRCRAGIERVVDAYRRAFDAGQDTTPFKMYGVTTGFGEFKKIDVPPAQLRELQEKILLSHAVGMGVNEDENDPANYFAPEVVRAAIALRINTFVKGHSGVRESTLDALLEMLNRGIIPLVPTRGSVGSSGDLCPLAHCFATWLGHGRFYQATTADALRDGMRTARLRPASDLPSILGLDAAALRPREKEGLALTNGATFCAALLALAVHDAQALADTADAAAALTLDATCGRTPAFDPRVHAARNFTGQADSARAILAMVTGSRWTDRSDEVQDVYSVRCAPAVHGAARDAIDHARRAAEAEINAATDNPLFFENDAGDFTAHSAGNFHGEPVGMAADFLAIAVSELAGISERRTQMLLDEHHNRGLPPNLIAQPGLNSGLMIAQYTAAALASENKGLCFPASVDSIPTSANTEDHVAMATTACRKVGQVIANTRGVLAIELMAAAQAAEWRWMLSDRTGAPAAAVNGATSDKPATAPTASGEQFDTAMGRQRDFARLFAGGKGGNPGSEEVAASLGAGSREVYLGVRRAIPALVEDVLLEPLFREARTLVASGQIAAVARRFGGRPDNTVGGT